jgi:L-threonylcarbamoyladenylate synthase
LVIGHCSLRNARFPVPCSGDRWYFSEVPAEVLSTHTPALFAEAVARTVAVLRRGGIAAVPTETVYGLAANAFSAEAVAAIYRAKGRPAHNPVIVHVASAALARDCCAVWTPLADQLAARFWPGPLTLVLPRSARIPDIVSAGGGTVGIRWPSHPFIQAVIRDCGFPLAAPSANPSDRLSPTTAEHVLAGLGDRIPLVIDAGQCAVGIESTVVDVTGSLPRILRPGIITAAQIAEAAGTGEADPEKADDKGVLRSPGLLAKHYSPRARVRVLGWRDDADLAQQIAAERSAGDRIHLLCHTRIPDANRFTNVSYIPDDPEAFARAIYGYLHACDDQGADLILIEALPSGCEWDGVRDRLARASA